MLLSQVNSRGRVPPRLAARNRPAGIAKGATYLEDEIRSEPNFAEIVGESAGLEQVLRQARIVAATKSLLVDSDSDAVSGPSVPS